MSLAAPHAVVIGAMDLSATVEFLGRFGFVPGSTTSLGLPDAAALYGLSEATSGVELRAPGATSGHVIVVQTPHDGPDRDVLDLGPLALDIYTTDIDADHAELSAAGVAVGAIGTLDLGPLVMRQCEVIAPDGWRLVLVEANHRRPSLLDAEDGRRHSEVHSLLWTVASLEDATVPFTRAGLDQAHVFPITHPALTTILSLPRPEVPLRMNLLVDDQQRPVRVELVEFPEDPREAAPEDGVLRAGIHALVLASDDLAAPAGARIVEAGGVAVAVGATERGGVRYQLWPSQP